MGAYDNIGPKRLRADLVRLAALIDRLEEEGKLLNHIPRLLKLMGDLRQKLFAYEVRSVERLRPKGEETDESVSESRRVVREALEREREKLREWERLWSPEEDQGTD